MARSVSIQFRFFTREEARKFLADCKADDNRTGDNIGDRIAASRRVDYVTTAEERRAAREYNKRHGRPLKTDINGNPTCST